MKVNVFRYDPSVDAEPYFTTGEIEWHEGMTALEALQAVYEQVEAFSFDMSCACRLCGRCAMRLNGNPCLVCTEPVADEELTFEPLEGFPIVRDLIVDKHAFGDQITSLMQRRAIEPFDEQTIAVADHDPAVSKTIYTLEYCARCGSCTSACPAKQMYPDEYVGPAAMLATYYRFIDPLDQGDRVIEAVSNGLFRCIMCGKCDQVCAQQDISHLDAWNALRAAAEERGLVPSYAK